MGELTLALIFWGWHGCTGDASAPLAVGKPAYKDISLGELFLLLTSCRTKDSMVGLALVERMWVSAGELAPPLVWCEVVWVWG